MPIHPVAETGHSQVLSPCLAFLLAGVSGLIVANMYYAQPLVGLIGGSLGLSPAATGLVVTLTQLRSDPAIKVGLNVVSGRTKIGSVVNLAPYERQALAKYTNDAGNHVSVEVRPAAALVLN